MTVETSNLENQVVENLVEKTTDNLVCDELKGYERTVGKQ